MDKAILIPSEISEECRICY